MTSRIEPEKITIVEGPPPTFERVAEPWVLAIVEGPAIARTARCVLRTFNGAALVSRCMNAWREGREAFLEYRTLEGLNTQALIIAARAGEVDEGQVLNLWVRLDTLTEDEMLDFDPDDLDGHDLF